MLTCSVQRETEFQMSSKDMTLNHQSLNDSQLRPDPMPPFLTLGSRSLDFGVTHSTALDRSIRSTLYPTRPSLASPARSLSHAHGATRQQAASRTGCRLGLLSRPSLCLRSAVLRLFSQAKSQQALPLRLQVQGSYPGKTEPNLERDPAINP